MPDVKSGIEMLELILSRLERLEKKVDILDQNIKKVANSAKVAELINKAIDTPIKGWTKPSVSKEQEPKVEPNGKMRFKFEPSDASKMAKVATTPAKRTISNVIVKGKMVTVAGDKAVPLPEISVKIFDAKDKLVKETRTNRAGYYQCSLPVGKYVAEFTGKYKDQELVPQNKIFEVPAGVQEFEII